MEKRTAGFLAERARRVRRPAPNAGPCVDGKFLRFDGERFYVRGVTYGTFAETEFGSFPKLEQIRRDFAAMSQNAINTVRTYTVPDERVLALAEEFELKLMVGRLGPLIALLYLLAPAARTWGRMRARWPNASPGTGSCSWPLRSDGRGLFLTGGVEEVGREAFLDGLRDRLRSARLRPKAPSVWDEADLTCDSALFWRARLVSHEGWGILHLRLVRRPRLARLAVPALGAAALLLWSPIAAAGAAVGLMAILLAEEWLFARKIRRTLTSGPTKAPRG